jgi:hypothetical protein
MLAYTTSSPKKPYRKVFLVGKLNPLPPEDPFEPELFFPANITENFLIKSSNETSS